MLHIALCCLEGSTLSNLVHRRRRCARIVLHSILCLEGSTPEDRLLFSLPRIERIERSYVLWRKEEIKKFVAFPGLAPLQPDAYAQP